MALYFLTGNKNKFESLKSVFRQNGIDITQKEIVFNESRSLDVAEIVKAKAEQGVKLVANEPFIVEDGAFVIPSLNNFPGPYVNFVLETIGLNGLLRLLNGKHRDCYFESALAYFNPKSSVKVFTHRGFGRVSEKIAQKNRANAWSELWRIYIPRGCNKTLAEMSNEEFQQREKEWGKTSHINKFIEWFKQNRP